MPAITLEQLKSVLLAPNAPYLYLVEAPTPEFVNWACVYARPERDQPAPLARFLIRSWKCCTKQALFSEFAASLQFPYYFGENWDAFSDCLTDLDWWHRSLGYVIYVLEAEQVLAEEPEAIPVFLEILVEAGAYWQQQSVPFRVLLQVERKVSRKLLRNLEGSNVAWGLVRAGEQS